jgi:hypothetical protein
VFAPEPFWVPRGYWLETNQRNPRVTGAMAILGAFPS